MLSTRHHQLIIKSFKEIKEPKHVELCQLLCTFGSPSTLYFVFLKKASQLYFHFEIWKLGSFETVVFAEVTILGAPEYIKYFSIRVNPYKQVRHCHKLEISFFGVGKEHLKDWVWNNGFFLLLFYLWFPYCLDEFWICKIQRFLGLIGWNFQSSHCSDMTEKENPGPVAPKRWTWLYHHFIKLYIEPKQCESLSDEKFFN